MLRQLGLPGGMQPVLEHVVSIWAPITSRALAVLQIHSTSTFGVSTLQQLAKHGHRVAVSTFFMSGQATPE